MERNFILCAVIVEFIADVEMCVESPKELISGLLPIVNQCFHQLFITLLIIYNKDDILLDAMRGVTAAQSQTILSAIGICSLKTLQNFKITGFSLILIISDLRLKDRKNTYDLMSRTITVSYCVIGRNSANNVFDNCTLEGTM